MFKKMFSRSSGSKKDMQLVPAQGLNKKKDSESSNNILNENVARESMNKAKRQLFQFDLPTTDMGFQDLLRSYEEGNRFQYIALTGATEETYESRIRRMVTFNVASRRKGVPQIKVPIVKLVEHSNQFNLSQIISKKSDILSYIKLSSIVGVYTPLISSFYEFSTVSITLHDTRKVSKTAVQTAKCNSNLQSKVELSLDCCVPRSSADKIILDVGLEQQTLITGEEWGTLQLVVTLETSESPYVSNMKEVVSVVGMPPALLENYKNNPNYIDTTITEAQKKTVRDMYESGDIADETEPLKEDMKPVTYARSTVGLKKKGPKMGKDFGSGWEYLKEARRPLEKFDDASVDPEGSEDLAIDTAEVLRKMKMTEIPTGRPADVESSIEDYIPPPPKTNTVKGVKFNELQV